MPDKSFVSCCFCLYFATATERKRKQSSPSGLLSFQLFTFGFRLHVTMPDGPLGNEEITLLSVEPFLAHTSRTVAASLCLELTLWYLDITLTNLSQKTTLVPIDKNTSMYTHELAPFLKTKMLTSKKEPTSCLQLV